MSDLKEIEVRIAKLDVRGREVAEFDEVVAANAHVHLEKMNDSSFCLIVETKHEHAIFYIFTKNGRAHIDANTFEHSRKKPQRRSRA